ncbi:hypothetical protein ACIA5D_20045 [Actinoplanes sp. NPDC051513]|uniref:hypothetical protein n=1 Tax=Actinoplanes sp. NPDC051513 TaxID=3363908 RepID=UPI0037990068
MAPPPQDRRRRTGPPIVTMLVQLLAVPNCPHAEPAAAVLRGALDEAGLNDVPVTTLIIDTQDEADRIGFIGSPTILIDGRDPFPDSGQEPALACRLYRHPAGLSGIPPIDPIRQALHDAVLR